MAQFRFYAELNDFLAPPRRGRTTIAAVADHASVKHAIESLGVPHTEVALVLRNGEPCALSTVGLAPDDRVAVYPAWRSLPLPDAAPTDESELRFIADAHLGRLARWLRFAGYDTLWHEHGSDTALAALALRDRRVVLTRDRALLMHRDVERGCFLRSPEPLAQLRELASRMALHLLAAGRPARCMVCNALPQEVPASEVQDEVPPRTRQAFDRFWRCPGCRRVYWHGSHWQRMKTVLDWFSAGGPTWRG